MKNYSPDSTEMILADTSSAASQLHADIEEMRQRLAALEARAPAHAEQTVGRKRHWRATPKKLTLMIAGVMLAGATIVFGQSAVDALFVSKDGKVGIGTTTPANKLSVAGNTDVAGNLSLTGNVGVGTTVPAAKLDIKDRIALQDANGRNYFKDSEKNDGKGLRVGSVWNQYGLYAETGRGALGGADGVNLQNGGLTINNAGVVSTSGDLSIGRFVSSKGRYQRDDAAETTYELSPRYHVSLTTARYDGSTRQIPQQVIVDLCGDQDGCQFRLGMTRWSLNTETETASITGLFYYSTSDGHWRTSMLPQLGMDATAKEAIGVDGNKTTQHVANAWNTCYFTDSPYSGYQDQSDPTIGMYLLLWKDKFTNPNRTCELTLID